MQESWAMLTCCELDVLQAINVKHIPIYKYKTNFMSHDVFLIATKVANLCRIGKDDKTKFKQHHLKKVIKWNCLGQIELFNPIVHTHIEDNWYKHRLRSGTFNIIPSAIVF